MIYIHPQWYRSDHQDSNKTSDVYPYGISSDHKNTIINGDHILTSIVHGNKILRATVTRNTSETIKFYSLTQEATILHLYCDLINPQSNILKIYQHSPFLVLTFIHKLISVKFFSNRS